MKAVRLHHYHEQPKIEEISEPKMTGPHDVIVRIGGRLRSPAASLRGRIRFRIEAEQHPATGQRADFQK